MQIFSFFYNFVLSNSVCNHTRDFVIILVILWSRAFLRRGRQREENISRARTVLSPRFLYCSFLREKRHLAMWMWLCEGKLKMRTVNHTRDKQIGLPLPGRLILLSLVWIRLYSILLRLQRTSRLSDSRFHTRASPTHVLLRRSITSKTGTSERWGNPCSIFKVPVCDLNFNVLCKITWLFHRHFAHFPFNLIHIKAFDRNIYEMYHCQKSYTQYC